MRSRNIVLVMVVFLLGLLAGQWLPVGSAPADAPVQAAGSPSPAGGGSSKEPAALPAGLKPDEVENIRVFERASNAVVSIRTVALRYSLFSLDVMQIPQGSGSGFVWDRDGHIVTNFHVIEDGDAFLVTLSDQSIWEAQVVGTAPEKDLAVLHIEAPAEHLVPLSVGTSSDLAVGQKVLALGNPFGLDQSLTVGVLSAVGRELSSRGGRTIRDVLQTDAAINPGNSGGPLLDSNGKLIGVNTAIYSPSGASAGVGFSIPVDTVVRLVPQLLQYGHSIQPGIGVVLLDDRIARRYGLDGVVVQEVGRDGPASAAGIRGIRVNRYGRYVLGDSIVAVDGQPVKSRGELLDVFEAKGVGAKVTLTLERDGRRRDVSVKLIGMQ